MARAVDSGDIQFAIHGGDISYADDWYSVRGEDQAAR
jgi:hypothetical protein